MIGNLLTTIVLALLTLGVFTSASSAVINDIGPIDGIGYFYDSVHGNYWMDVYTFKSMSYNEITAYISNYDAHVATQYEVSALIYGSILQSYWDEGSTQSLAESLKNMGAIDMRVGGWYTFYLSSGQLAAQDAFISLDFTLFDEWEDVSLGWDVGGTSTYGLDDSFDFIGGWVVCDAAPNPVPEPATIALLGIGLVGLAGVTRRRI